MKRIVAFAVLVLLAGCGSITAPVVVISDSGDRMTGSTTAALSGGTFQVAGRYHGKPLSCGGAYNALDSARTIAMPVRCSDGRDGTVTATRDSSGMNGTGHVLLSDGTRARFIFGNVAVAQANVIAPVTAPRAAELPPAPARSSLPAPEWVVAQSEPYLKCGRDEAARLALTLPNESASDIATAAELRCSAQFQTYSRTIRGRLPADLHASTVTRTKDGFRQLAVTVVLSTRERTEPLARPPAEPPAAAPRQREWAI